MAHNDGGNIFIWTLFWLVLVAGVLPVFVNVSAMILVQQQFVANAQSALAEVQYKFPHTPELARRQLIATLNQEMPRTEIIVTKFYEQNRTVTATISLTMVLPVRVAGYAQWRMEKTFETR
ncbi:MAG: hypothetical protein C7B47_14040 [Sulfobacillus thermosulfidooxidans]|uniref:DUF4845 domain-containing protein n=1 Tax=Sulfobacillus thermosulfidooxidans TaxID=28034 RepID=A0A2T2WRD0_SULTH|nr:MAG: hypothetical protein C7B47_14040 [Sulfobacillus thermosulfidooxidans]